MNRNLYFVFAVSLLIGSIFIQSCQKKDHVIPRPDGKAIVTKAGDQTITVQDILVAFQEQHSYDELNPKYPIPASDIINTITEQLLFTRSLAQKAHQENLEQTDEYQKNHKTILMEELYQKLLLDDVLKKIKIPEKDIQRYYDENKETLFKKRNTDLYKIRGLKVSVATWGKEKAAQRAQAAYNLLKKGNSFKAVAVEYSDSLPTQRGTLMSIPPGGFGSAEIEQRIANLGDGEFTEPYLIKGNYLIHYRETYIPPEYTTYEDARNAIIQKILQEEKDRRITLLTQDLLRKYNCLTNPDLLTQPDADSNLIILSVPGIYEMTLHEFENQAQKNQKLTIQDQQKYLSLLALKAVCYAEATERGWGEQDVEQTLTYWDDQYLAKAWILQDLKSHEEFSDAKFKETYEKNKNHPRLRKPPVYELYHIFFKAPIILSMTDFEINTRFIQCQQKAYQALDRIKQGYPFEMVAAQFAQEESEAVSGGFMGKIPIDNRWLDKIGNLTAGQISQDPKRIDNVLKEQFGYELYYVKNIEPGDIMTLDEWKTLMFSIKSNEWYRQLNDLFGKDILAKNPEFHLDTVKSIIGYLRFLRDHPEDQTDIVHYANL